MTETGQTQAERPQDKRQARDRAFIDELKQLSKGRLAVLRRNAGEMLSQARGVNWFYGLLAKHAARDDRGDFYDAEAFFLVATLFALDKSAIDVTRWPDGNFGSIWLRLKLNSGGAISEGRESPFDRRFNILLDADFDPLTGGELAFRLRQAVKRVVAAKDPAVRINWPQLLRDLKGWRRPRRYVQKRWATSYYAPALKEVEGADATAIANDE